MRFSKRKWHFCFCLFKLEKDKQKRRKTKKENRKIKTREIVFWGWIGERGFIQTWLLEENAKRCLCLEGRKRAFSSTLSFLGSCNKKKEDTAEVGTSAGTE